MHEDRRIIFSYEEAYKAIYSLCTQKEMKKPPPGAITSITAAPEDDNKLKVRIDNMQDNSGRDIEYSRDFLAAALMLFCRSQSVPIPKKANKSVELKTDGVILRMTI